MLYRASLTCRFGETREGTGKWKVGSGRGTHKTGRLKGPARRGRKLKNRAGREKINFLGFPTRRQKSLSFGEMRIFQQETKVPAQIERSTAGKRSGDLIFLMIHRRDRRYWFFFYRQNQSIFISIAFVVGVKSMELRLVHYTGIIFRKYRCETLVKWYPCGSKSFMWDVEYVHCVSTELLKAIELFKRNKLIKCETRKIDS